jgi:hypothetical protein
MNDDRRIPGVAFRASVAAVVLLVLYPLSFGPACWITSRTPHDEWPPVLTAYWALSWIVTRCPSSIFHGLLSYGELFSGEDLIPWITLTQADDDEPPAYIYY